MYNWIFLYGKEITIQTNKEIVFQVSLINLMDPGLGMGYLLS